MNLTKYHAKFYAHELSRIGGGGVDRLGRALFDACVELNPHQIEAALFAMRSPLARGVLLADEVGLGKTVEAGLVLCQFWAERRRRLLVICPASLRKQWALEMAEKFNLPAIVVDARTARDMQKADIPNPFRQDGIIVVSMHYAGARAEMIRSVEWDLVVIDEAHKLRNAYRESNRLGQAIRAATADRRKILLTATPLQNSLLELYGLSTLVDENLFGDAASFRTQFMTSGGDLEVLRARLRSFCWRTLRRDVLEYVKYTDRKLVTRPFRPSDEEHRLYEAVSGYLQREGNYALPAGQKHLLVLLVRKVLASSPQAVAGTLQIMRERLMRIREESRADASAVEQLLANEEMDAELLDELLEDQDDLLPDDQSPGDLTAVGPRADLVKLDREIKELEDYIRWAESTGVDTKTRALLKALEIGFTQMAAMSPPGPRKAVVFTESRRTQMFLRQFLESNGYAGRVVTFNGSNNDPESLALYESWARKNRDTGRATGSRAVDLRTAIIDVFREEAEILIATEAAAEGINLQFCALVVNHDLPWNPQRIEQRIGRCHRYGQQHDVVVINFLNERNEADRRVQELLESKFHLFNGVFGASDEVLGTIESGVDFEGRVLEIYQQCRTSEEISTAFARLQEELEDQIGARLAETRRQLLENFDEDVHDRLKINLVGAREQLDRMGRMFWALTTFELAEHAVFHEEDLSFELGHSPVGAARPGSYRLISKGRANISGEFLYRLSHPLGEYVLDKGRSEECPVAEVTFQLASHPFKVSVVDALKGRCGWLHLQYLRIDSFDREESLLFSAFDDAGADLDQETCVKLFTISGTVTDCPPPDPATAERLAAEARRHAAAEIARALETNSRHFAEARDQLDQWAADMELAAQKELEDTKRRIRDFQRQSRQAPTLGEQHALQEEIAILEKSKRRLRQRLFDLEDEIAAKRDVLVASLERRMQQRTAVEPLFSIRWTVR
jgi:superfamily II DNA or RNA helicase